MDQSPERELAATMFTDICDFSNLRGKNEFEAFELANSKCELIKQIINLFNNTWMKEMGDGTIFSFQGFIVASSLESISEPGTYVFFNMYMKIPRINLN